MAYLDRYLEDITTLATCTRAQRFATGEALEKITSMGMPYFYGGALSVRDRLTSYDYELNIPDDEEEDEEDKDQDDDGYLDREEVIRREAQSIIDEILGYEQKLRAQIEAGLIIGWTLGERYGCWSVDAVVSEAQSETIPLTYCGMTSLNDEDEEEALDRAHVWLAHVGFTELPYQERDHDQN